MPKMTKEQIRIEEITMQLVHYFITKENYQPVLVNGINNEIWLENSERKFQVIRINYNYIHNNEQLQFDVFKTKSVLKQIKKKTFSFKIRSLNILLNTGDNVKLDNEDKYFKMELIKDLDNIYDGNNLKEIFPELDNDTIESTEDADPYINLAIDINNKTSERNTLYEKVFTKKLPIVTYIISAMLLLIFALPTAYKVDMLNLNTALVHQGEWYRIFTTILVHSDFCVILCFLYSLSLLGLEVETTLGKLKTFIIFISGSLFASLFNAVLSNNEVFTIGGTGGVMAILAAVLYVGYFFRPYLSSILKSKIIPVFVLYIILLFITKDINIITLVGGLVGGLFTTMILGVPGKSEKSDRINGLIVTSLLIGFLIFMLNR